MRKLLFLFLWLMPLFADAAHQPAMWQTFYKQSFTGRNLSTAPLTVGGLKGDAYDYKVIIYKKSTADSGIKLRCNGDTGANYRRYLLYGGGSTVSPTYSNAETSMVLVSGGTNTGYANASIAEITGKSGGERAASVAFSETWGAAATYIYTSAQYWKNTADELTSLVFLSETSTAQDFDLVILQKPKLAQDAEWELVGKKDFANVDLNSVFTGFSGLDGDRDEEYLLKLDVSYMSVNNDWVGVRINGDGGNSTYWDTILRNNVGTVQAWSGLESVGALWGSGRYDGAPLANEFRIKAKSGQYRQSFIEYGGGGTGVTSTYWLNTADKIENLRFCTWNNGTTVSGTIELHRRGKSVSASKPTFETLKEVDVDGEFSQGHTFDLAGLGIPDADNETMFVLEWHGVSKTSGQTNLSTLATLNGATGGSDYYLQIMYASNSTAAAQGYNSGAFLPTVYANYQYPVFVRTYIFPKSGKYRPALTEYANLYDGGYYITGVAASWWLNTADKLRSIKVYATSANQTQFKGKITLKRLVAQ